MFHLYFGAFDIVLYLGGTYFALVLANAICDGLEDSERSQTIETIASAPLTSAQVAATRPVAPAAKTENIQVKVAVNS